MNEEFAIAVVCNDTGHEGRTAKITTFTAGDGYWYTFLPGSTAAEQQNRTMTGPETMRHRLRCKLCGLTVTITQAKLRPILDSLRDRDIRTLELVVLDRVL